MTKSSIFPHELHKTLSETCNGESMVYSPLSIAFALNMMALGASNATLAQILDVLGTDTEAHDTYKSLLATLSQAKIVTLTNAAFPMKNVPLHQDFVRDMQDCYNATIKALPYTSNAEKSRSKINKYVEKHTRGHIAELMPKGSISSDTRNVIVNTIYFKGEWEHPFKKALTKEMPFNTVDGSNHKAQMMTAKGKRRYDWVDYGNGIEGLAMQFTTKGFEMIFVKPSKAGSLEALQHAEDLALKNTGKRRKDEFNLVQIPKFTLQKRFNLGGVLQTMGITDAFSAGKADFSRMFAERIDDLHVSSVVHEAVIIVNEKGAEATAATGSGFGTTSIVMQKQFVLDRSFVVYIHYQGTVLFVARVIAPQ